MDVYLGRGNTVIFTLLQDGSADNVQSDAIYRAMFHFGGFCVDTDNPDDPIELIDGNKQVKMALGLVPGLEVGTYDGVLTVFDVDTPDGIAWGSPVKVVVEPWETCSII